jgi:hypothetical protein
MARTWLSITVELIEGRGQHLWPRPGRIFTAARSHTFAQFAQAIDAAFARWDLAHLHEFHFPDPTDTTKRYERVAIPDPDWDDDVTDLVTTKLSRLDAGQQFVYVFDLGDDWTHLCTVADQRVDPIEVYGIAPARPAAYFGWGDIPDQYGRRYLGDGVEDGDLDGRFPPDPKVTDLPPLRPWWGSQSDRP